MSRRVRATDRLALSRRHLLAAGVALPLLPARLLAAPARPRFRRRQKTPAVPIERQLFGHDRPPTVGEMQAFIARLQTSVTRALDRPGPVPWRQLDLLAGLALRYGRPELLPALAARLPARLPASAARPAKWLAADSRWRRRWQHAPTLTWAWPEAGVLTRRALPLRLPA